MKQMPQIHKYMSSMPHTIEAEATIQECLGTMREFRIRHLPVLSEDRLIGLVTDRDLKLAASFPGATELKAEDIMTDRPYSVVPEAPLDRVVLEMAEHKYGCAIIQQMNGKIVGIFTANDGLRVLGQQLEDFYKMPVPDTHTRVGS